MLNFTLNKNSQALIIKDEKNFRDECEQKNINILFQQDNFFIVENPNKNKTDPLLLNACLFPDVYLFQIESIKTASKHLKSIQSLWYHISLNQHRRGELIRDQLFPLKKKTFQFLDKIPKSNLGAFALLDANNMLVMPKSSHPLPMGEIQFHENKIDPPSRAYLKLWELFTLYVEPPKEGELVIDLGSCPGGWSWVLSQLKTTVNSVDKAPLADNLKNIDNIHFIQDSAFALNPLDFKNTTWVLSDIIAYPSALVALIKKWLTDLPNANFVFTIKFQGQTDFAALAELKEIENSKVFHLFNNKHEVTWVKAPPEFFKSFDA